MHTVYIIDDEENLKNKLNEEFKKDENYKFKPANIDIKYISINPNNNDKMFIVSVSKEWLIRKKLESIVNNRLFNTSTYLSIFTDTIEF